MLAKHTDLAPIYVFLMHWGWDKMASILQITFSDEFSWMKIIKFLLKFSGRLYLTISLFCCRVWLDAVLPMVIDRETTAQDKCLEMLDSILLGNIVPYPR